MHFVRDIFIGLISVVLFYLAWPPNSLPIFGFIAFIPILWLVFKSSSKKRFADAWLLFIKLFLLFFVINFSLCSWVMNAHWGGGLFASIFNATLMSIVLIFVYHIKNCFGERQAFIAFPTLWLGFEYLHLNWELTWPWMTLGNLFAEQTSWIQWYEYTGVLGGSFWLLLANLIAFITIRKLLSNKFPYTNIVSLFLIIIVPIYYSGKIYERAKLISGEEVDVLIIQPNYEPHHQKFKVSQEKQLAHVKSLIDYNYTDEIDLILLPETFIVDWIWESRIETTNVIVTLKTWMNEYPNCEILTGASTGKVLQNPDTSSPSVRKSQSGQYYEVYNTALLLSPDRSSQIFHKSKLVPGAEMTPFASVLKPVLEMFPIELGGQIGNFGVNDSIYNLNTKNGETASMICYESVFGDYVREFVSQGALWINIITNDGWWGDTFGYQQHNAYARLRAIENRRYIARSANTGISSMINHLGEEITHLDYAKSGAIVSSLNKLEYLTFYSKYGDYIGRIASLLSIVYILQLLSRSLQRKRLLN